MVSVGRSGAVGRDAVGRLNGATTPANRPQRPFRKPGRPLLASTRIQRDTDGAWHRFCQIAVGGLRLVDIDQPRWVLDEAWDAGFSWVDYITSWNDPVVDRFSDGVWAEDEGSPVPWLLDPIEEGSRARVTVFSSEPLPSTLVVRRTYSDHGRVGSFSQPDESDHPRSDMC